MSEPRIALIGSSQRIKEAVSSLSCTISYTGEDLPEQPEDFTIYIDLNFEDQPDRIFTYQNLPVLVLGAAVKESMMNMLAVFGGQGEAYFLGLNAFSTFLAPDRWEVSYIGETEKNLAVELSEVLGKEFELLPDQVGMVAPRVISLIINEAFLLEQEGTAKREDIDTAMKLGTNYPHGPFEWAEKIGYRNLVQTLDALFDETGDLRFKPVRALRKEAFEEEKE